MRHGGPCSTRYRATRSVRSVADGGSVGKQIDQAVGRVVGIEANRIRQPAGNLEHHFALGRGRIIFDPHDARRIVGSAARQDEPQAVGTRLVRDVDRRLPGELGESLFDRVGQRRIGRADQPRGGPLDALGESVGRPVVAANQQRDPAPAKSSSRARCVSPSRQYLYGGSSLRAAAVSRSSYLTAPLTSWKRSVSVGTAATRSAVTDRNPPATRR